MLNIVKERQGDLLSIQLDGAVVGEFVDFDRLIGATPRQVNVNCKNLVRINSNGVRAWIKFFQALQKRGTEIKFSECSPTTVDHLNAFMNFACGGEIESVYVPYSCSGCHRELVGLYQTQDLKAWNFKMPELNCPACGKLAVFDDHPDYFKFATR